MVVIQRAAEPIARLRAVLDLCMSEDLDILHIYVLFTLAGRIVIAGAKERGLEGLLPGYNVSIRSRIVSKLVEKGLIINRRRNMRTKTLIDFTDQGREFVERVALLLGHEIKIEDLDASTHNQVLQQLSWHPASKTLTLLGEDKEGEISRWLEDNDLKGLRIKGDIISIVFDNEYDAALFKLRFC